ncbi:hypothetical protein D3C85_1780770 [compost metagenome]
MDRVLRGQVQSVEGFGRRHLLIGSKRVQGGDVPKRIVALSGRSQHPVPEFTRLSVSPCHHVGDAIGAEELVALDHPENDTRINGVRAI